jgi:hypothetical protein
VGAGNVFRYVLSALFVLGYAAVSVYGGYAFRDAKCERDRAAAQLEVAESLAILARQYATADAAFREEQRKRQAVLGRERVNSHVSVKSLPTRDCGWTGDERGVMQQSYCSAFPDAPTCPMRNPM